MFEYYEKEALHPSEKYVRINYLDLMKLVSTIFRTLSVVEKDADTVADVIVTADLMGISSHGTQRLRRYVDGIRTGNVNVKSDMKVVEDHKAVALIDADNGLGQVAASKGMNLAIKKAETYGIGLVLVRNSNHFGIAGYYSLMATGKGLIGVTLTNSENLVAYTNTLGPTLGTNPIAVGIPRECPPPILFDAATSVVPVGKIELYRKLGRQIPEGWVMDEHGRMISGDASRIHRKIKEDKAAILPLGGVGEEFGGHKGSGLSFLVDIISGVLSGSSWGTHVGYTVADKPAGVGHTLIALDVEAFMPKDKFFSRVQEYVQEIKSTSKHPKADRIWIPGEKAWLTKETRIKMGIPVSGAVYEDLKKLVDELKIRWILDQKT